MSKTITITIKLPEKSYKFLKERAVQHGISPDKFVQNLIEIYIADIDSNEDPIYKLPEIAEDLEVPDFSENIDHYLYGLPKR